MDLSRKLELIDQQITEANDGSPSDFDAWENRTEVVLRTIFGVEGPTYRKFQGVSYTPSIWTDGTDFRPYRTRGVREAITIMNAAKLELELSEITAPGPGPSGAQLTVDLPSRIFIVHGQDEARKYELEALLQKLVSEPPVILHQEPNGGRVLIEKLETSAASAGYAVVLLTGDDLGRPAQLDPEDDRRRARQNVVLELGFFIGLLGRAKVAVLYEEGLELPSDLSGLVYISLDGAGAWKGKVASEISHAGIDVDWTALSRV